MPEKKYENDTNDVNLKMYKSFEDEYDYLNEAIIRQRQINSKIEISGDDEMKREIKNWVRLNVNDGSPTERLETQLRRFGPYFVKDKIIV